MESVSDAGLGQPRTEIFPVPEEFELAEDVTEGEGEKGELEPQQDVDEHALGQRRRRTNSLNLAALCTRCSDPAPTREHRVALVRCALNVPLLEASCIYE